VKHRQGPQVSIAAPKARLDRDTQCLLVCPAVRVDGAARNTRGAAGVVDAERRELVLGHDQLNRGGGFDERLEIVIAVAAGVDALRWIAQARECLRHDWLELSEGHETACAAVVEDPGGLGHTQSRVHRHEDLSAAGDGVVEFEHRRHVGQHHRDAVAGQRAEFAQRSGYAGNAVEELGVGHRGALVLDGGRLAPDLGASQQKRDRAQRRARPAPRTLGERHLIAAARVLSRRRSG